MNRIYRLIAFVSFMLTFLGLCLSGFFKLLFLRAKLFTIKNS